MGFILRGVRDNQTGVPNPAQAVITAGRRDPKRTMSNDSSKAFSIDHWFGIPAESLPSGSFLVRSAVPDRMIDYFRFV
jgi:hypothetical protein